MELTGWEGRRKEKAKKEEVGREHKGGKDASIHKKKKRFEPRPSISHKESTWGKKREKVVLKNNKPTLGWGKRNI